MGAPLLRVDAQLVCCLDVAAGLPQIIMPMKIIGCILAGGRGLRLGGRDKAVVELAGGPLWSLVAAKLTGKVDALAVLAPERPAWLERDSSIAFIADQVPGQESIGPAGGLLAALGFAHYRHGGESAVLTAPVDAPFFPDELPELLKESIGQAKAAIVEADGRLHPTFGLWTCAALEDFRACVDEGELALHKIADRLGARRVSIEAGSDRFLNINTPEDLDRAESLVRTMPD